MHPDKQSGLMQLRSAKVGSNPAKVRVISKRYADGLDLYNRQGEQVVSIASNGKQSVIGKNYGRPKSLVRRKRIPKTLLLQGISKAFDVALMQTKHKNQALNKPKKACFEPVNMQGFAAWQQTQQSFRVLK